MRLLRSARYRTERGPNANEQIQRDWSNFWVLETLMNLSLEHEYHGSSADQLGPRVADSRHAVVLCSLDMARRRAVQPRYGTDMDGMLVTPQESIRMRLHPLNTLTEPSNEVSYRENATSSR